MSQRRAFSIVELLVVIGIIFLLAALVFFSLRGVRQAGLRAQTSSTLRSYALAHAGYSNDHNQQILPGAVSPERLQQLRLRAHNPLDHDDRLDLSDAATAADAGSYVLRLLPYLDSGWSIILDDYRSNDIQSAAAEAIASGVFGRGTAETTGFAFSSVPAIGYNATFLGGNDVHGSAALRNLNPWTNPAQTPAVTRAGDVRRPAFLVTFAPSVNWQHAFEPLATPNPQLTIRGIPLGSAELRPPRVVAADGSVQDQWRFVENAYVRDGTFAGFDGVPWARWSRDEVPTARFDGSVATVTITNLAIDLRHWFPAALP